MMALTQELYEQDEQGSCADPGIFVRGGGVKA